MIKFVKAVLSASIAVSLGIAACASNAADIKERNFKVAFVQQKDHPHLAGFDAFHLRGFCSENALALRGSGKDLEFYAYGPQKAEAIRGTTRPLSCWPQPWRSAGGRWTTPTSSG